MRQGMGSRFTRMRGWLLVALFWTSGSVFAAQNVSTRFERPFEDGAVLVLWKTGYTAEQIDGILARIADSGARSVMVPVFGCQTGIHSSDVGACELGPRDQAYLIISRAVARGMNVAVLPIIATPGWDWRGLFDPKDVAGWFRTYTAWLKMIAQETRARGASELIVGSEFKILFRYTDQWKQVLRDIRPVFGGPLIVTANWDHFDYGFWDESDAIGISAYYPLSKSENPSQEELNRAWSKPKEQLLAMAKKWKKPIYLTEIGYPSSVAAAQTPWIPAPNGDELPDHALQARCFEAFRAAWSKEKKLVRASVWAISDPDSENWDISFDYLGKPAEEILRHFFTERSSTERGARGVRSHSDHWMMIRR